MATLILTIDNRNTAYVGVPDRQEVVMEVADAHAMSVFTALVNASNCSHIELMKGDKHLRYTRSVIND